LKRQGKCASISQSGEKVGLFGESLCPARILNWPCANREAVTRPNLAGGIADQDGAYAAVLVLAVIAKGDPHENVIERAQCSIILVEAEQ